MDEASHGVRGNQTKQPQDDHHYSNGIQHDIDLSIYLFSLAIIRPDQSD
jgi:hypothetical protein